MPQEDSPRTCQGVQLPVPAAICGTTEGECCLISKHVHHQLDRCNPLFHMFNVLLPTGFVLVGQKKNNKFILWRQFNVKGATACIQFIRYVFNSFEKASSDTALLWPASGKPFQTRGAAAAKERSPKDVFILTTSSIWRQHYVSQNDDYQPSSSR